MAPESMKRGSALGPNRTLQRRRPVAFPPSRISAEESEWLAHRHFAVIVDAGSSGSRLMIYSWRDVDRERTLRIEKNMPLNVLPVVEKGTWEGSKRAWQVKVEPGLSSFAGHVQDLRSYLEDLFSHAQSIVPPYAWSQTPVHVLATAGMRMLAPEVRQSILQETCQVLHSLPFSTKETEHADDTDTACGGQVRVISGEEEGLFGWIAINYLMDGFGSLPADLPADDVASMSGRTTYGFLDMGGASTQIAFEPSAEALSVPNNTHPEASTPLQKDLFDINFRLLDASVVKHQVFVTTFLGFGTNAARSRYLEALTSAHHSSSPVLDPCLPKNLRIGNEHGGDVVGTGSFSECLALQQPLLDRDAECTRPPCLFHGVHVPTIDFTSNQFIGVSEYWYSAHDVFDLGGAYDYSTYQKAAQDFCAEEWTTLEAKLSQKHYKEQVTLSRLQMQCFKAAWITTVLHEGLHLPRLGEGDARWNETDETHELPNKVSNKNLFQSINDVRGVSVSWALGKAILEASERIPDEPCESCNSLAQAASPASLTDALVGRPPMPSALTMGTLFLFLVVGLVALAWRVSRRRDPRAWTPLPTNDTVRDKSAEVPHAVVGEDGWNDATDANEHVPLHTRRMMRRKQTHKIERNMFSNMIHGTAAYAKHHFKRFVRPKSVRSKREPEPSLSVRIVPDRLQDQSTEQLARDGYPRVPTPWASALVRDAPSSPHTPVLSPARSSSPMSSGRISRTVSPLYEVRSDYAAPVRTPRSASGVVASGSLYASRPPSRGPSPMLLESRRPSLVTTSPHPPHLSPVDTRMRSPIDLSSSHGSPTRASAEAE